MFMKHTMNKIMVLKGGLPAQHKLGNIGRDSDDYIRVYAEDENNYIGNFEEGFGFVDVRFKKSDCRNLTKEEIDSLNSKWYLISGNYLYQLRLDDEGTLISLLEEEIKQKTSYFDTNEMVVVKRSDGTRSECKVVDVLVGAVRVEVDTPRGKGYKFIPEDSYDSHIQKMKRYIAND